jgi:hypothetical protein
MYYLDKRFNDIFIISRFVLYQKYQNRPEDIKILQWEIYNFEPLVFLTSHFLSYVRKF